MAADLPVPTIPTPQDYLDAARAYDREVNAQLGNPPGAPVLSTAGLAATATFRAAVDSAFAAGWRAGQVRIRAELGFLGHVAEDTDAPASKREGLRRFVELMYAALDDDGDGDQG